MIKICECCGKEYNAYRISQKCCSYECSTINRKNNIKICKNCGKEFKGYKYQKYCSVKCKYLDEENKTEKICKICGKKYKTRYKNQKCCSHECSNLIKVKRVKRTCPICGKKFEIRPSSKKIYCSHKCTSISQGKSVEKTCKVCGKKYEVNLARVKTSKYCSYECVYIAQKRRVKRICPICNKEFEMRPSGSKKYCSENCYKKGIVKIPEKACEYCNKIFKPSSNDVKYCSTKCRGLAIRKRLKMICIQCEKEFEVTFSESKYRKTCSRKCRGKYNSENKEIVFALTRKKVQVECALPDCNKTKMIKKSQYENNKNKRFFCSLKHKGEWKELDSKRRKTNGYKGSKIEVKCVICGEVRWKFPCQIASNKGIWYCHNNSNCRKEAQKLLHPKGEKNINWIKKTGYYCDYCGDPIILFPNKINSYKYHFCNKGCFYNFTRENPKLGKDNPNYHNGISNEPYSLDFTEILKRKIRKRDNYICQECGLTQEENIKRYKEKLTVHHIDYIKDNLDEDNLISLCKFCHGITIPVTIGNRKYWTNHFNNIMESKKVSNEFIKAKQKQLSLF